MFKIEVVMILYQQKYRSAHTASKADSGIEALSKQDAKVMLCIHFTVLCIMHAYCKWLYFIKMLFINCLVLNKFRGLSK